MALKVFFCLVCSSCQHKYIRTGIYTNYSTIFPFLELCEATERGLSVCLRKMMRTHQNECLERKKKVFSRNEKKSDSPSPTDCFIQFSFSAAIWLKVKAFLSCEEIFWWEKSHFPKTLCTYHHIFTL